MYLLECVFMLDHCMCTYVTPQKYPRIFIIILLNIPGMIEPNLGFSGKIDKLIKYEM